jgi:hypothetical protein
LVAVQRTSSDLKLNPHVHAVFLDGVYRAKEDGDELAFRPLVHLTTRETGVVQSSTTTRPRDGTVRFVMSVRRPGPVTSR